VHDGTEGFEAVVLEHGIGRAAVAIDNDGGGAVENIGIVGPAVGVDGGGNAGKLVEAGFKKKQTGAILVLAGPVAGRASEEDDFFVRGEGGEGQEQREEGEEISFHWAVFFIARRRRGDFIGLCWRGRRASLGSR